jgi:pyridoxine 5-phosphate synthase
MDPDPTTVGAAAGVGADRIEIYTEPYAEAFGTTNQETMTEACAACAAEAERAGLGVNAGHDLNLENLPALCHRVPNILEVSIGHALVADALEFGLHATVKAYLETLAPSH